MNDYDKETGYRLDFNSFLHEPLYNAYDQGWLSEMRVIWGPVQYEITGQASELVDACHALDQWISKGGFLDGNRAKS